VIYRGERRDVYTGLYCRYDDWDSKNELMDHTNTKSGVINQNLEQISYTARQAFDQLKFARTPFTIDELVDAIKGKEEKPALLLDYLALRNEELSRKAGVDITTATYEKYERIQRYMSDFLTREFKVRNYPLSRMDGKFLEQFFQYLRNVRLISNNTAVKYITSIKTVLMPAIREGIIRQDPFRQARFRSKTVYKGFLTDEEIELIKLAHLGSPDLERIRDQFLFCCYTGLAYSDLQQLDKQHLIRQSKDQFYILKPRQKTGQQSVIPLLPVAMKLLRKYSLTGDFRDVNWYVSANQKMNQRLKSIGEMAGLSKTLHMHLARHTFATTITLSKGVPIESVSAMLGHATLRQTQHYAKIVALKVVNDMTKINGLYE